MHDPGQGRVSEPGRVGQGPGGIGDHHRRRGARPAYGRAGSSSRAPPAIPGSAWRWSAMRAATARSSSCPRRRARKRRTCCCCAAPICGSCRRCPIPTRCNYVRYSGRLAEEIAAKRAERRDLGQPVRQSRQPPRPLPDDRPRDLGPDRGQGRRLHLLGRHRRHLVGRRHRAQGAQPQGPNLSVRLHGLGHLQLVCAARVEARGQFDHRGHRQQPRDQEPRRLCARRAVPDHRRGNAAGAVRPRRRGGADPRRLDRDQYLRRDPPRTRCSAPATRS